MTSPESQAPLEPSPAKFSVGQVVQHKLFGYRGVIVDLDATFSGDDEWYEMMARSQPPKDAPWYNVLVHVLGYETYVAERNLEPDTTGEPIAHEAVDHFFEAFEDGVYVPRRPLN